MRLAPLFLGVLLAAYWGRVLRMAHKARRRTGRAANFVPRERTGLALRVIWGPVVVVWVVHPFVSALGPALPLMKPIYYSDWIAWPAVVVAALCLLLSRICWKAMGRHWRMGIDPDELNPLIITGPYAWVRHPIYALSSAMMLATMAALPSPLMLSAGGIHLILLYWELRREENHLLKLHGEDYAEYRRNVGGFLPRIKGGK